MQLPLSASALVILGVGAVLVGASILVVVAVRRRKPASRPTRVPPDMRVPQQPAAPSGPYAAGAPAAAPQVPARPAAPTVPVPVEPAPAPVEQAPVPAAPPVPEPQPLAGPVAAAATPRPTEVSARVDQPRQPVGAEQVPPDPTPPAGSQRHHQAGSGRTVAAAVAQAFAVRAAAGRGAPQRPADPPLFDGGVPAAQESAPPQPDPVPDAEEPATAVAPPEPAPPVDGVDPAASTDPDGIGLAAAAHPGPGEEPQVADAAEPGAGADLWAAAAAAHGSNGDRPADTPDHGPDGNGRPPEGWQVPEPGPEGHGPAEAAGAGLLAAGWTEPAVPEPVPADPEPATVPAPRPGTDSVAPDGGPVPDARDRLLAVLLDDPERAVGATVELESCLRELDRLSDAVRTGRAALRDVLHRLAAAGLRPEQLARLARLPQAEVEELLEAAPAEHQA